MPKGPQGQKPDTDKQYQRFLETAKQVEASEDEGAFDRAFSKVVKPPAHKPKKEGA